MDNIYRKFAYTKDGKTVCVSIVEVIDNEDNSDIDQKKSDFAAIKGITVADLIEVPNDGTVVSGYENAYDIDVSDQFILNRQKCINYRITKLRARRKRKLNLSDVLFIRAIESADTVEQASLATKRQALRDFPTSTEWDALNTVAEISAFTPAAFSEFSS